MNLLLGIALAYPALNPTLTLAQAQADFDLMRRAIQEAHAGFDRYAPRAEMARDLDDARRRLRDGMPLPEFSRVVAESMVRIRCGHTHWRLDPDTQRALDAAPILPLQVAVEGSRPVVAWNNSPEDRSIRPGMEIVSINGRSAASLLRSMGRVTPRDGFSAAGERTVIGWRFAENYWWLVERGSEFAVTARTEDGRTIRARLMGRSRKAPAAENPVNAPAQAARERQRWWTGGRGVRFLENGGVAQLRIDSFRGDDFPKWLDHTFRDLREKHVRALVIDLRGNGGGDDNYGSLLVAHLTDRPFRYFDRIWMPTLVPSFREHTNFPNDPKVMRELREKTKRAENGGFLVTSALHAGVGDQAPAKESFGGKVFVLTDGGTFSTAADVCAVLRSMRRATFIGEETGGAYEGNNSGLSTMVTLPNSKFQFNLPMFRYTNAVTPDRRGRGTMPHHVVPGRLTDGLRGVDRALEKALALSRR